MSVNIVFTNPNPSKELSNLVHQLLDVIANKPTNIVTEALQITLDAAVISYTKSTQEHPVSKVNALAVALESNLIYGSVSA